MTLLVGIIIFVAGVIVGGAVGYYFHLSKEHKAHKNEIEKQINKPVKN